MSTSSRMAEHLETWERVHSSRPWGRYPSEDMIRFVARTFYGVPERNRLHMLEMGCGQGCNLWYLAREGFSVAGIDGSPTAVKLAGQRLAEDGLPPADLRSGNFSVLPWPTESFDAVFDIEAIYANEITVIRACLAEAHRVLKPGGYIYSKMFGTKTSGFGRGTELEPGTMLNPTEGPCGGFGLSHFFSEPEIRHEFRAFSDLKLDWLHRSDHNCQVEVFEWIIQARK